MADVAALVPIIAAGYACGAYAGGRAGLAAAALLLLGLEVAFGTAERWVPLAIAVTGPYLAGRALRSRRVLVAALETRTAELERTEEELAVLAVRHERARAARELHDVVAHHLAVIVVQAGAGRMTADGGGDRARERFLAIREAGTLALADMVRLVDAAGAAGDPRERLDATVARARAAGLEVRVDPVPELGAASATVQAVVQEALTNALKHAGGASVRVCVRRTGAAVAISVEDDGGEGAGALAGTGAQLGLSGLRERLAAVGGSLTAGPAAGGGWRLSAQVPTHSREGHEVAQSG